MKDGNSSENSEEKGIFSGLDFKKAVKSFNEDWSETYSMLEKSIKGENGVSLEKAKIMFDSNLDDPAFRELIAERMKANFEEANCNTLLKKSVEIREGLERFKKEFAYDMLSIGNDFEKLNQQEGELFEKLLTELEKLSITADEMLIVISQVKKSKTK